MGGDLADVRLWACELEAVHERFVHRFSREEPRQSALAYMRGLVAPLERKNGWTLAEEAGHAGPDRIHRLLNRIDWDADEVLDDVRDYVVENLGDRDAVLIVDDTGFLKKGVRSAGVQRQYSGTAGRTAMAAHACLTVLRARQLDKEKAETDPPSSSTSALPRSDA
ncbi:IS701 family transposase [Streptomyces sp. 1222.5]|uniref:IS701 family transposase n=1 Tax=Streptomyces sp. 1222.5 TaxID=1881026 RepID=UPI003EBCF9CA